MPCSPLIVPPNSAHILRKSRLAAVVQKGRVEVAITGVEHAEDSQSVGEAQLPRSLEGLWKHGAGDRPIHRKVVRRQALCRGEDALPPSPEGGLLGFVSGRPYLQRAVGPAEGRDLLGHVVHTVAQSIKLDE